MILVLRQNVLCPVYEKHMDHRYGRHGPHAWEKRRKRLFERKALVPFVHNGVIVVYVPAMYLERITIVVEANEFSPKEDPKELLSGIPQHVIDDIRLQTKTYTDDRVREDRNVKYSPERIRVIAVALAKTQIPILIRREKNGALELHGPVLEEFYANSYVDLFIEKWTKNYGREIFPEEELAIKEDALRDKQLYRETILPNLTYLAILRASNRTKESEDDMVAYLADIARLAEMYTKAYRTQQGGGQAGPATFLG